ncbi:MAG: hypothetical protein Q7R54_00820 [bacterium]|nr:hypothetical protein [bacterium]
MNVMTHIERIREKPEHIRKQVALGIAVILTAIIALVWLGASLATGTFALRGSSFAENTSEATPVATKSGGFMSLLGAAGAALTGSQGSPHIEVVGESKGESKVEATKNEPTVLPF